MTARLASTAVLLAVVLLGCGGATGQSPGSTGGSGASAPAGPTEEPSLAPGSTRPLCGQDSVPCDIEPGTYLVDRFSQPFTFTTGAEWTNEQNWAEGGELRMGELGHLRTFDWAAAPAKPDGTAFASADKLRAYLAKLGQVKLTDSQAATVGGAAATRFDVETTTLEDGIAAPFVVDNASFLLQEGRQIRFWVMERGGALVVLFAQADKGADFATLMTEVGGMLSSLTWE